MTHPTVGTRHTRQKDAILQVIRDDDDHLDEVVAVAITDMQNNLIAELHGDHWDFAASGDALRLHPGEELNVRIVFVAADGHRFQLPPSGQEYTLNVEFDPAGIADYEGHSDHGHFKGLAAGNTTAAIQIYHGSHADGQTNPPLPIEVVDHGH